MNKVLSILAFLFLVSSSSFAQGWGALDVVNPILDQYGEQIYTICSDKHANIYVPGASDTGGHNIVGKWNGSSWTPLGVISVLLDSFMDITQIIADTNDNIYVVGQINNTTSNYVAKWDGTSWSMVGGGFANGQIIAICFDRYGNLYAGGVFTDGVTDTNGHSYVAKWNGTSWSELGTGANALKANNAINTIFVDTFGNVYAAGAFTDSVTSAGGNVYVAKWDGTSWSELGAGVGHQLANDVQIFSVLADGVGNVYAAGYALLDSGYNYVFKWDGTSWSKVGSSADFLCKQYEQINQLCFDLHGNLYAAGMFTDSISPTNNYDYVAKWDGTSWSELGTGSDALNADNWINSICSDQYGNIYAAGEFTDTTITLMDSTLPYHPVYVAKYSPSTTLVPIHQISGIKVYPNPTQDIINVSYDETSSGLGNTGYLLYDITGNLCRSGQLQQANTSIDISELSPGTYILNVANSQGVYKVVKE